MHPAPPVTSDTRPSEMRLRATTAVRMGLATTLLPPGIRIIFSQVSLYAVHDSNFDKPGVFSQSADARVPGC